jgi:hypothetical protein
VRAHILYQAIHHSDGGKEALRPALGGASACLLGSAYSGCCMEQHRYEYIISLEKNLVTKLPRRRGQHLVFQFPVENGIFICKI